MVNSLLGFIGGVPDKATYHVKGFLNTGAFGRASFNSTGQVDMPKPASD